MLRYRKTKRQKTLSTNYSLTSSMCTSPIYESEPGVAWKDYKINLIDRILEKYYYLNLENRKLNTRCTAVLRRENKISEQKEMISAKLKKLKNTYKNNFEIIWRSLVGFEARVKELEKSNFKSSEELAGQIREYDKAQILLEYKKKLTNDIENYHIEIENRKKKLSSLKGEKSKMLVKIHIIKDSSKKIKIKTGNLKKKSFKSKTLKKNTINKPVKLDNSNSSGLVNKVKSLRAIFSNKISQIQKKKTSVEERRSRLLSFDSINTELIESSEFIWSSILSKQFSIQSLSANLLSLDEEIKKKVSFLTNKEDMLNEIFSVLDN